MPIRSARSPILVDLPFDFRSQRFEDDARALARTTGASLDDCRQALFMAEGDLALARDILAQGWGALSADDTLH